MSNIARRYASALIKLGAGDQQKASSMLESLKVLNGLFENKDSCRILQNPIIPADLKKDLLDYGLKQGEASAELKALIEIMIEAGRINYIPKVLESYQKFLDEIRGMVKATLITAVALSGDEIVAFKKELSNLVKKTVEIEASVDPSVLGGFVANIGNYRIDLSLKSKLEALSNNAVQDTLG